MPQQRKLSEEEKCEAEKYLALKANKKMVQDKLAAMSGKVILLKDLTNLSAQMKSEKSKNDLEAVARSLANKHGNLLSTFICVNYDIHMVLVITTFYIQNFKAQCVANF